MKPFFLAAACVAVLALSTSSASAQTPVQGVVTGGCGQPGGCGASAAPNHVFSHLMWWKSTCSTCGHGLGFHDSLRRATNNAAGMSARPAAPAFNPYPQGVPGTLVFPNHQFIRSPRDYFMVDAK